jgi:hypothetical protein
MIPTRDTLLTSKLSELPEIWLQPACQSCGRQVNVPCVVLALKHGRGARLADVLAKLRCSMCSGKPSRVKAADAPIPEEHMIAERGSWVVPLLP